MHISCTLEAPKCQNDLQNVTLDEAAVLNLIRNEPLITQKNSIVNWQIIPNCKTHNRFTERKGNCFTRGRKTLRILESECLNSPHIPQNKDLLVKWCYQIQGGLFIRKTSSRPIAQTALFVILSLVLNRQTNHCQRIL